MKDFINVLVILLLFASGVGIGYGVLHHNGETNMWGIAYIPLIIMMVLWGVKIDNDYK